MNPPPPPDEPAPPGTEPPLPPPEAGFSSLAALAAAPPPPPPPLEEDPVVAPVEQVEMAHPADMYQPYEAEVYDTPEALPEAPSENVHISAPPIITRAAQPLTQEGPLVEEAVSYGQPTGSLPTSAVSESTADTDKPEIPPQPPTSSKKKKKDKDREKVKILILLVRLINILGMPFLVDSISSSHYWKTEVNWL